jgi:hypothetical protein
LVAGTVVVDVVEAVVAVVAVVAVMASGAVVVVVAEVVFVSSTTLGASAFTSGFFSSGFEQATRDVARATRARADVSFFMVGVLLL